MFDGSNKSFEIDLFIYFSRLLTCKLITVDRLALCKLTRQNYDKKFTKIL